MPQPLSSVIKEARPEISQWGDEPLARHPQLALMAMRGIASWSCVESFMIHMFVQLLGGSRSIAANVYRSLDSTGPKSAAIDAAANTALDGKPEIRRLLKAIQGLIGTNQKARDKLAHGVWGDTPTLPDALLLTEPKLVLEDTQPKDIFVYREKDFQDIIDSNNRLADYGIKFNLILINHPSNGKGQLYDQLCTVPEIQERLLRLA